MAKGFGSKMNKLLSGAAVSGGVAGIVALVLAIWCVDSWRKMGCGFETGDKCKFPVTEAEIKEKTDLMNIKFVLSLFVIIPSVISVIMLLINMMK